MKAPIIIMFVLVIGCLLSMAGMYGSLKARVRVNEKLIAGNLETIRVVSELSVTNSGKIRRLNRTVERLMDNIIRLHDE